MWLQLGAGLRRALGRTLWRLSAAIVAVMTHKGKTCHDEVFLRFVLLLNWWCVRVDGREQWLERVLLVLVKLGQRRWRYPCK